MASIDQTGYQVKTQQQWFDEEIARYQAVDPNWNLDPSTPDGAKAAADAEIFANLDELGQAAYNSKDPDKARGSDLDTLCAITGVARSPGASSTVSLTLTGTNGTVITAGSLVEDIAGEQWSLDADATIASGTATVSATSVNTGQIQANIGDINRIVTPLAGWQTVTNPGVATPGTNPETDAELRLRRNDSVSLPGQNQVDATYAAVAAVADVRHVRIYENDTASVDANSQPAHSTEILVDGGADADIALAIYLKRNPGPLQHQSATAVDVDVTSPVTGNTKEIKFSRPTAVPITVAVTIANDGSVPASDEDVIKQAILDYLDGNLIDADQGFNQFGFGIGQDVFASRFYTPVNKIIGARGASSITSITVNAGATQAIAFNELATFALANISVTL